MSVVPAHTILQNLSVEAELPWIITEYVNSGMWVPRICLICIALYFIAEFYSQLFISKGEFSEKIKIRNDFSPEDPNFTPNIKIAETLSLFLMSLYPFGISLIIYALEIHLYFHC